MLVSIPKPCSQSWSEMTPVAKGRFCQHCNKAVVDYSAMTDAQILAAITNGSCGRFAPTQLDRHLAPAPRKKLLFTAVLTSFLATITPSAKAAVPPTVQLSVDTFTNGHKDTSGQVITGQVIDSLRNTSIAGAFVQLKGTTLQTSTDAAGNFQLFIPDAYFKNGFSLEVLAIGYMTIEVAPLANVQGGYFPVYAKMSGELMSLEGAVGGVMTQTRWQRFKQRLRRSLSMCW